MSTSSTKGLFRLYRDLWIFAEGQRRMLLGAFTLLLGSQLVRLVVPYLSGRAINALQLQGLPGITEAALWLLAVFLSTLVYWSLHGPGRFLERNVALTVRERATALLMRRLLSLPLAWHEAQHSASTSHRVEQSARALFDFAQTQFIYLQQAVQLVGPIAALWLLDRAVGAAALIGLAVISVSLTGFDRAMLKLAFDENKAERRYGSAMIDTLGNITTVFALRQRNGVMVLLRNRLLAIFAATRRSIVLNESKWCAVEIFSVGLSCVLLGLFAYLASRGLSHHAPVGAHAGPTPTLPLGNIYMVWEYAQRAGGVLSGIAAHYQTFVRQQADYASGDEIRNATPSHFEEPVTASPAMPVAGESVPSIKAWRHLEFSGLLFNHASGRHARPALDHLAFSLERGRRYALIGGSGSGKTTLLRVLSGLYLANQLALEADGRPLLGGPVEAARALRRTATLIPQDAEVFEGSLSENLSLCESVDGAPDASHYSMALQRSCASDFIDASEAGLSMEIAERGANWSGGQRQRVALARGILASEGSGLILLDEPTASLDPATERRVYDNLFMTFPEACIVSSVHRLNLLDRFDVVMIMEDGRLLDRGSVADLTSRSPQFRALLAAQNHERRASKPAAPSGSGDAGTEWS